MKKVILVDGNSLMFRSYYATAYTGNLMKTKDGLYTNALFGFVNMISKLINEDIKYAFVAFDAGKQTFRHKEYEDYKGGRKPLPDELREQIPIIKEYLDLINVKRMESLDYEADDLIATVATKFRDSFDEILVITGDRDLLQLVDDKVSVGLTKKGVGELDIHSIDNFYEKEGFYPNQLIDYKGIAGDSSDNLPGVKGIGDKTAIKLLNSYQTLEGIYEHIDELTPKAKELFNSEKETAFKCKKLATLCRDANIDINLNDIEVGETKTKELVAFFTRMEFNQFLKKIKDTKTEEKLDEYELSYDYESIKETSFIVSEVFGSNYYKGEFLGLGIYCNQKYYFVEPKDIYLIKDYLENKEYKKYTFDFKQLYFVLKRYGIDLNGVIFDLAIANYLINPEYSSEDIKVVADNYDVTNLPYQENIYGSGAKATIPDKSTYVNYALAKCEAIEKVKVNVYNRIFEDGLEYLFTVELNLSKVLGDMEYNGLVVDLGRLKRIGEELSDKAKELEKAIYEEAHHEFNLNSPKQLGEVLFEELKLPHGKKNKNGYSTSVDVLEKLASDYKIVENILDYRGNAKLISTYVNGIFDVSKKEGEHFFIHPLYKQAYTNTGRLSSIEPNIQNMPIRTERGQVIREIFTSRFPDGVIVSSDYSQIELRVLAHMANDEKMIEAFKSHIDFHTQTASQIYEVSVDDVTKDMRRTAKAINFGIIYGMSSWGLSERINITPMEANMFINKYFYTYQGVKDCLDNFINSAKEKGYSQTLFGRRRYIPQLNDKNAMLRGFGERTAMNSPIQGTAADIIKIAMNRVSEELKKNNLKTIMIAQVHDELVFDVPKEELEIVKKLVKDTMESAVTLSVPLEASIECGKNWFEAK